MKFQPEMKKHETDLKELRNDRHSEDSRLTALKARLQEKLSRQEPTLLRCIPTGRVNVA